MSRRGYGRAGVAAALMAFTWAAAPALRGGATAALEAPNPFSLSEHFLATADIDLPRTTACVDTAAPGTLTLCAPGAHAAVDPASSRYVLAGGSAVKHFAFDGAAMRDVTAARGPAASGAVDADWAADGRLVLASATGFTDSAPDATGKLVPVPGAAVTGLAEIVGVAAAPGRRWLLDASGRVSAWAWTGSAYARRPAWDLSLPGATGVRVSRDGACLAARLDTGAVRLFAWTGGGWRERPETAPPAGVRALDVAFFPEASGYRTLSAGGRLRAWGFSGAGVAEIPSLAIAVAGATTLAPGFAGKDALAVTPSRAAYVGVSGDASREVAGHGASAAGLGGYASPGVAASRAFALDHDVDMVALEVAQVLPAGTAAAWEVSTDGGATWTAVAPSTPTPVPPGPALAWRATLATSNPAAAPSVDRVDVHELAARTGRLQPGRFSPQLIR